MNNIVQSDVVKSLSKAHDIPPEDFMLTIKETCFKGKDATDAQLMQFILVADKYDLNPLVNQIWAFPSNGGVQTIVGIDGWMKIINENPQYDGMKTFENFNSEGKLVSCTCSMYRKDRSHPIVITEYLSECYKKGFTKNNVYKPSNWDLRPVRMLRHKSTIQAARYAFNLSGIIEEDEIHDGNDIKVVNGEVERSIDKLITDEQVAFIKKALIENAKDEAQLLDWLSKASAYQITEIEQIPESFYPKVKTALKID